MNHVTVLLFSFVALGLFKDRLGRSTYPLMAVVILACVSYAYLTS